MSKCPTSILAFNPAADAGLEAGIAALGAASVILEHLHVGVQANGLDVIEDEIRRRKAGKGSIGATEVAIFAAKEGAV